MIPRIIHQTWKTSVVPSQWQTSVQAYQRFCEKHGFEYRLWTDEDNRNLIQTHFPWFLQQYDAYPQNIQRADVIRYFILYHYGGVYSDLDIEPKEDLFYTFFQLYENASLCLPSVKQGNGMAGQNYSNCFMMSEAQHPFWPRVWHWLQNPYRTCRWKRLLSWAPYFQVLFTTGPGVISDAALHFKETPIVSLPAALIQPGVETDPTPVQRPESVVKLLRGESWQKGDANFWRSLGRMWGLRDICLLVGVLVWLMYSLCRKWWSRVSSNKP